MKKSFFLSLISLTFLFLSCSKELQKEAKPKEKAINWVIQTDIDEILNGSNDIYSISSNITFYWYPYDSKTVDFQGDTIITFTGDLAEKMLNNHVWIEVFAYASVPGGGINLLYPVQHFLNASERDTIIIKNPRFFAP